MKKQYKKPLICIESLMVSEFIAGPCGIDVGFGEGNANCTLIDISANKPITLFIENSYCNQDPRPNESNDYVGICYHGSNIDPTAYFGS